MAIAEEKSASVLLKWVYQWPPLIQCEKNLQGELHWAG
jgi:hypothetical protein